MKRPVIFLDIDGVLIHVHSARHVDPACVAELNRITDDTGAAIVVSSSWRLGGLEKIKSILQSWRVTGDVIDITKDLSRRQESGVYVAAGRGAEIAEWRERNGHTGTFVILDDDTDMGDLGTNLVLTDWNTGLTHSDADDAITLLAAVEMVARVMR